MKSYNSVDEMVKDLSSEEFYRQYKVLTWHKFKNWCWYVYTVFKFRVKNLISDSSY